MSTQPDKIFTPNGDGWNDYFEITYENPADGMVNGKIYDLKGKHREKNIIIDALNDGIDSAVVVIIETYYE